MREIRRYQRTEELLLKKAPFQRIVKEIANEINPGLKFQDTAVLALQEVCEQYLVSIFQDSVQCAKHGKRITVQPRDIQLARRLRGEHA